MTAQEFEGSLLLEEPPPGISAPLAALWWDSKGDASGANKAAADPSYWSRAHGLVDELETREGMSVHAYLHRKEGSLSNADYWYNRAGRGCYRPSLDDERQALLEALLTPGDAVK